jgi:hypothetical protein
MTLQTKRLLKLADFLDKLPRTAFDLSAWVASQPSRPEGKTPGSCGFAGCAMGWAAHEKMFRGLKFDGDIFDTTPIFEDKNGVRYIGFEAAEMIFGLPTNRDALYLFHMNYYPMGKSGHRDPTPKRVARRIRRYVAKKGDLPLLTKY